MRKALIGLLLLASMPLAFADDTANIKIKITGTIKDNRYFLCEPNVGCLSIYNAVRKGKAFPVYHSIDMDNIYVTNVANMRLYPQGLPKSCNVTVDPNKTITIYGNLVTNANHVRINGLRCTLS